MRAWIVIAILIVLSAIGYLAGRDYVRRHPQNVPWTRLDLTDPVGMFTRQKLTRLANEPAQCRTLLDGAGSADVAMPPFRATPQCGYDDGMRLVPSDGRVAFAPAGLVTSCPVAASLLLFERQVLQPAAARHLGARVDRIEHAGSYSCRRLYGRSEGPFSEHATADAVDITGFRLDDGRIVSVLDDWPDDSREAVFLRDVRDGACELFATVLSPDYNDAHRDHLHLDHAMRGNAGWHMCR
jgi:hypothetical protein